MKIVEPGPIEIAICVTQSSPNRDERVFIDDVAPLDFSVEVKSIFPEIKVDFITPEPIVIDGVITKKSEIETTAE